jgi:hypothetical protein
MPKRSTSKKNTVTFKTSKGKKVSFKVRPLSQRSKPRKLSPFAKFVKKYSKKSKETGASLFKKAAKEYNKTH